MPGEVVPTPAFPCLDLEHVIDLFLSPFTAGLHARHAAALARVCREHAGGFMVKELPHVQKILELTHASVACQDLRHIFTGPLCELLRTLAKPFTKQTLTDELKLRESLRTLLVTVGKTLVEEIPADAQICAAEMLAEFASGYGQRPPGLAGGGNELEAPPSAEFRQYHANQRLIEESDVVPVIVTGFAVATGCSGFQNGALTPERPAIDPTVCLELARALRDLSREKANACAMAAAGVLRPVALLLERGGTRDEITEIVLELLWNVLEHDPLARDTRFVPKCKYDAYSATASRAASGCLQLEHSRTSSRRGSVIAAPQSPEVPDESCSNQDGTRRVSSVFRAPNSRSTTALSFSTAAPPSRPESRLLDGSAEVHSTTSYSRPESRLLDNPAAADTEASGSNAGEADDPEAPVAPGGVQDTLDGTGAAEVDILHVSPPDNEAPAAERALQEGREGGGEVSGDQAAGVAAAGGGEADIGAKCATEDEEHPWLELQEHGPSVEHRLAVTFTRLFQQALQRGYRPAERELRNELLVVIGLLAQIDSFRRELWEAGFVAVLLAASVTPEQEASPLRHHLHRIALSTEPPEFELRRLAWQLLAGQMCQEPEVLEAAVAAGFVRVLLSYINLEQQDSPGLQRWSAPQLHTLRRAALSALHIVAPLCPQEYLEANGPAVVLQFIVHSTDEAVIEAGLRHLHRAAAIPELLAQVGARGGVGIALDVFSESSFGEGVRLAAVLLLAQLCAGSPENCKRFRKAEGTDSMQFELSRLRMLDPTLPSAFGLATLDAARKCIVADRKNLLLFLVADGMRAVLDILECANASARPLALTILAEMLRQKSAHSYFEDWRSSRNEQTAVHLLLDMWRAEEALRGMTDPQGVICNTDRPLAGTGERTAWVSTPRATYGWQSEAKRRQLAAIGEAVSGDDMLTRIYVVLAALGFETCKEYASVADAATLEVVEQYVRFRQGEIWQDIKAQLELEGVEPVEADAERLTAGIRNVQRLARQVAAAQGELLGSLRQQQAVAEVGYYRKKIQQAQREKEARAYRKDNSQLSTKERIAAKLKKEEMLRNSFRHASLSASPEPAPPPTLARPPPASDATLLPPESRKPPVPAPLELPVLEASRQVDAKNMRKLNRSFSEDPAAVRSPMGAGKVPKSPGAKRSLVAGGAPQGPGLALGPVPAAGEAEPRKAISLMESELDMMATDQEGDYAEADLLRWDSPRLEVDSNPESDIDDD